MRIVDLLETYHDTIRGLDGDYEVFRNPSRLELMKLLNATQFGFAKAVLTGDGDILAWDANLIHDLTPYARSAVCRLELSEDRPVWRHSFIIKGGVTDPWEAGYRLLSNPNFRRLYPQYADDPKVYDEDFKMWHSLSDYTGSSRYRRMMRDKPSE